MGEFKKQHYVPQTYLRRFTADGERLYVFDKLQQDPTRRIRRNSVRDIAHEDDFYDIAPEVLEPSARLGHNEKDDREIARPNRRAIGLRGGIFDNDNR
jgi:Protein of unknown function (DUF4238)